MTLKERNEHRAKIREMKTEEEREAYCMEHHEIMQKHAKEPGIVLPDELLRQGSGKGLSNLSKKVMEDGKAC